MVVPFMRDAATPLGASLVTTKLGILPWHPLQRIYRIQLHQLMQLVFESYFVLLSFLANQKLFVGIL